MKDLTKYIESLLDGIKNPCEVKYVDNIYYVEVVYDYDHSATFYRFGDFIIKNLIDKTESMLATYIPATMFKVSVKRINIPIEYQPKELTLYVDISAGSLESISGYIVDNNQSFSDDI
jgi:hypothetical protein